MIDAAVVIANWNGKKYLKDCFESLAKQSYRNFKIIFVDNGSHDGSADFVRENFPETEIIRFKKNTGFCFGYNAGIKKALEDDDISYVLALNNDTKLHEKFLENLLNCAKNHPQAGSIQSKMINFFEPEKIDCAGILIAGDGTAHNRGYGENSQGFTKEEEIFGTNGAASLFTREALEKTKLRPGEYFDNDHFAFYEDVDLAWRMRLAGFESFFCPTAVVYHVHSGTAGKNSLFKAYYLHRNYFLTVFKNYPSGIMMKTLGRRFSSYIRLIFGVFQKGKKASEYSEGYGKGRVALTILKAWVSVIGNFPAIARKRRSVQRRKKANNSEIRLWLDRYQKNI
ncbi:MAG TPA: glycosyltransferase family 2 protein [Candidatus Bathyarchaeia archaeon]|nr:glycosyltransferase family 2 protein [Candidatus Bathyarchaeia archaeon]